jgi:predicted metalloendopeptidase
MFVAHGLNIICETSKQAKRDPHAPRYLRAKVNLSDIPEVAEAYACKNR